MAITIPRPGPAERFRKMFGVLGKARSYPIIPMAMLLAVLVVPAIFAPWIAPHPPKRGVLTERLLPPFWVGDQLATSIVVDQIDPVDFRAQILLSDAQIRVNSGEARIIGDAKEVTLGDQMVDLKMVVEEIDPNNSKNQILLKSAQSDILYRKARTVGGEEVAVGSQVEELVKHGGSANHLLGTDKVGRDILSRIIHGSRISIVVAGIAIFIGGAIGTSAGLAAGYFGGWVDALVMRLVDISLAIPIILLALVLVTALGASFATVVTVLVLLLWSHYARMARGVTLSIRSQDYIARAKVAGASDTRIIFHHVFPNVLNSLVVLATLQVGFVIIVEATLSFLGAGIPRPNPAWGLMVADGRELIVSHWWVAFFPGLAILLVVLSMNLMGDWLRDRLDPKQRQL